MRTLRETFVPAASSTAAPVDAPRVVLVDNDPISRHVLGGTLSASPDITLIAATDGRGATPGWHLRRGDLAVLVSGPKENHVLLARTLAEAGVRTLLIGVDWSKHRLDAAFAVGAAGCLNKDWAVANLCAAVVAAASGYVVLSPDLIELCVPATVMNGGSVFDHRMDELTEREREVLALLADGLSTAEVSRSLAISPATVKSHVSHSLTKLGARNRLEAVLLMQAALGCGVEEDRRPRLVR